MKICRDCNESKYNKEFRKYKRRCIPCDNKHQLEYGKQRRYEVKEKLVSERNAKCFVCDGSFPPEVFDFHHKDESVKDRHISDISSLKKARIEAEKCLMVCSNCHRMIHSGRVPQGVLWLKSQ